MSGAKAHIQRGKTAAFWRSVPLAHTTKRRQSYEPTS